MSLFEQCCDRANVGMEISAVAEAEPDRLAIITESRQCSFGELNARVNQLAHLLRDKGLVAGDGIALICSNRIEFAEVALASHRLGLRFTPVNWHLTASEAAYVAKDCDAKAIIADSRNAQAAESAIQENHKLQLALIIDGNAKGYQNYEQAIASYSASNIDQPARGTVMQYTSGTTGKPKGVLRSQPDPSAAAGMQQILTAVFQFEPDSGADMSLVTGPLYHAGPYNLCLMTPLSSGIPVVIMDKWQPEHCLSLIEKYKVTHCFMVPTMFERLLQLPFADRELFDLSTLRFVIHGAAPCNKETKQKMLEWFGPIIWEMFAGTEGPGTLVSPHDWLAKPGTVGKPGPEQVRILNDNGEQLGVGEEGQVWLFNNPNSSFEYYKSPDKTAEAQRVEGYFSAGDIGYIDEDGFLFLTGRSAEIIISGGVNIYPQEIDNVLIEHPAIADVACVGVPNGDLGEVVKAVVCLHSSFSASDELAEQITQFGEGYIAKQKWPRSVDFVDTIPRSEAGKVLRRSLRDRYWSNEA